MVSVLRYIVNEQINNYSYVNACFPRELTTGQSAMLSVDQSTFDEFWKFVHVLAHGF